MVSKNNHPNSKCSRSDQKELLNFDDAERSYQKAIDLVPTYTDALCNLGICLSLQEKYEDAEVLYKKALAYY